ncbi:Rieske (2Fe-2S) protein [Allostreptomyces psammosilenae]|uniref:Cytochrome bc1 complex Rieske iron-sulfur subunit n=1 Tax=Allostreptomyces psammosilenae TaxID=1892865 RepID=A0A852ZYH0_9ACTN|nr:Rieske (2Fe-2S) protein [Allostreptomyces psammosilenae]NYI07199.1 Rieske Fe-S protein [Allostreptomyces psammosilenae]
MTTSEPARAAAEGTTTRRQVLRSTVVAGAVGAGAWALAGCAEGAGGSATPQTGPTAPVELGPESEVPVGGGKVYPDAAVVVTRPSEQELKAFSAVCPHQACLVSEVGEGGILCRCHGSRFDVSDGSVVGGPSPSPLPAVPVRVQEGRLVVGPEAGADG